MLSTSNTTDVSFCKQSIKIVHTMETESNTNLNSEEQLVDPAGSQWMDKNLEANSPVLADLLLV
jgi:hypothetical protein